MLGGKKMEEIKQEDIKLGDLIYMRDKVSTRSWVIKIKENPENDKTKIVYWWWLGAKELKNSLLKELENPFFINNFSKEDNHGNFVFQNNLSDFLFFKLNKKEKNKINKLMLLGSL